MSALLSAEKVKEIAALEVNALLCVGALAADRFEKARITSAGTEVYDINGELLFRRVPVRRGGEVAAFADIAANPAIAGPLLSVSSGLDWNERALLAEAEDAARRRRLKWERSRFVAYSYPKVAVQFLTSGREVAMLELRTWKDVPQPPREPRELLQPSNFERWSLLDELPKARKEKNAVAFRERVRAWDDLLTKRKRERFQFDLISTTNFEVVTKVWQLMGGRELHYSARDTDHSPCFELRGQETGVWCVAASTQMLLDFYRYEYTQTRIAQELGLGTPSNPNGLPYSRAGDVVTGLEALTSSALDATMLTAPAWSDYRTEINANHPLISFIPGHSRAVAGYHWSKLGHPLLMFRGLLVYDPWPPNQGVITRWENFDAQTYWRAFTAAVKKV